MTPLMLMAPYLTEMVQCSEHLKSRIVSTFIKVFQFLCCWNINWKLRLQNIFLASATFLVFPNPGDINCRPRPSVRPAVLQCTAAMIFPGHWDICLRISARLWHSALVRIFGHHYGIDQSLSEIICRIHKFSHIITSEPKILLLVGT